MRTERDQGPSDREGWPAEEWPARQGLDGIGEGPAEVGNSCTDFAAGSGHHSVEGTKNELKPWLKQQWVIPPEQNADFVCAMENVLEVYHRPYDPKRPVVCFDEASKQLVKETRTPIPAAPGRPATTDYEYERNGTANLFMMFEPLGGQRHVEVTERRTTLDYAQAIKQLVDERYPEADKIVLVQDNLNTHKPASLYEAFSPEEASAARGSVRSSPRPPVL